MPLLPTPRAHNGSSRGSASGPSGKKRGRKRKSCEECFRRKIRCDGVAPCIPCIHTRAQRLCSLNEPLNNTNISLASLSSTSLRPLQDNLSPNAATASTSSSRSAYMSSTTLLVSRHSSVSRSAQNGRPHCLISSAFHQHVRPLFNGIESNIVAALASVRASFNGNWNWIYEVVDDDVVDALFDVLAMAIRQDDFDAALESSDNNADPKWQLCLTLAMVLAGIHVSEYEVACGLLQHSPGVPVTHNARACHDATKNGIEEALCATVKTLVADGNPAIDLSFVQTMLIHCFVYLSEGKSYRTLTPIYGSSLFDAALRSDLLGETKSADEWSEREIQTCRRAFWNIIGVDRFALLSLRHNLNQPKLFSMPAPHIQAAVQREQLPTMRCISPLTNDVTSMHAARSLDRRRTWRYVNSWMRARICRDMAPVCDAIDAFHHSAQRMPYSLITQTARRLELSAMLLPAEFRFDDDSRLAGNLVNDYDDLLALQDLHVQRTRYMVGISYYKAHELLHRLAVTDIVEDITRQQRKTSGTLSIDAAGHVITCVLRGRHLAKNRGDTLHIWHSVVPTTILTLAGLCAAHALVESPRTIPTVALQTIQRANMLLDVISDKRTSWRSLHILAMLQDKVLQLRFLPSSLSMLRAPCRYDADEAIVLMRDGFSLEACSALLERVHRRAEGYDSDTASHNIPPERQDGIQSRCDQSSTLLVLSQVDATISSSPSPLCTQSSSVQQSRGNTASSADFDVQTRWWDDLLREYEEIHQRPRPLQEQQPIVPLILAPSASTPSFTDDVDPMLHFLLPFLASTNATESHQNDHIELV